MYAAARPGVFPRATGHDKTSRHRQGWRGLIEAQMEVVAMIGVSEPAWEPNGAEGMAELIRTGVERKQGPDRKMLTCRTETWTRSSQGTCETDKGTSPS